MKSSKRPYSYKWLYILIPATGLFIAAILFRNLEPIKNFNPLFTFIHAVFMTSGIWIGCMLIVGHLWRKYPWEHFPVKHLIYEIVFILLFTNIFSYGLYKLEVGLGLYPKSEDLYVDAVVTNLITLLITAVHEAVYFYQQWKYNFSKSVKLEKDTIEAKYETLKTQINPHFLFNSLNSLTTLVEENQQAVEYIQNLSEFLRYILKSRDRELVLVREDVQILKRYISLQKSRFKENLHVSIDIKEDFYHFALPPLVLQMLVENCLKHNIVSKEKPLKISILAEKGWIHVENNLQKKNNPESMGSGLKNIKERYQFFSTNEVKITETNTTFKVSIPLLLVDL